MAAFPYRQLIVFFMYLMVATQPNHAFSLSKQSKFNISLGRAHWEAACKVHRYLRQKTKVGLLYRRKGPHQVHEVCEAAFACHIDDRRSGLLEVVHHLHSGALDCRVKYRGSK